ncbi:MAG: hypothetical protein II391_05280 [Kiritimatiellae bacterium]|nr:hypothetical protein [Kiritimatiellia bacterium]
MNARLFSDEIRERERRRRRKDLLWSVASFVLHVAVFAAIVMMTPVKSLVFDKEKKKANPAADLSADRIEQIADSLSQARINELLRQLEALQAVLHNMDLMKEELQKDYDAFAAKSAESLKETLAKTLDEVEAAQKEATAEQSPMIGKVEKMLAEERLDLTDEARSKWLYAAADELIMSAGDKVAGAQARAGNALDRIQVQAEFGGYRKTAEASGKVRDAQIEAATMQNQAQKEASEIGYRMGDMRGRVKDLENHEKWLGEQRERLQKAEAERKDAEVQLADATKLRDEAERARNDAQSEERRLRDEAGKANAEAKAARDEAGRLAGELKAARRALEQAKKERDRAEKAKKGGA